MIWLMPFLLSFLSCTTQKIHSETEKITRLSRWQYATSQKELSYSEIRKKIFQPIDKLNTLNTLLPDKEGFVYLRHKFSLSSAQQKEQLAVFLGRIIWADKTYFNGTFLGQTGAFPPKSKNFWNISRYYEIPQSAIKKNKPNELIISIYTKGEGALSDIPVIGPRKKLHEKSKLHNFLHVYSNIIIFALLLFIASYHLLIYWYRRKDKSNLYYSLLLLSFALYNVNMFIWAIPHSTYIPYLLFQKIIISLEFLSIIAGVKFFYAYFQIRHDSLYTKLYYGMAIIPLILINISWNYHIFLKFRSIVMLFILFFLSLYLYWTINAVKEKKPHSKPLLVGTVVMFVSFIHDIILVLFILNNAIYIGSWGFAIFLFSISYTLAKRFVNVHNQVEDLNANLEQKVLQRTEELNQTLEEIQTLKEQQDGDYFLTTLLLNPLNSKAVHSENVRVDFVVKQKKYFTFRKYEKEIGGDICTAHTIYLHGKRYTVFLNADAMGKSMQGAGGILVLGSVFHNIIERTHTDKTVKELFPEKWLKTAIKEMHNIFESFDGSMLISLILGLVDDATGVMYYLNAEHPFMILYRNGKAEFRDKELKFHKIGTPGMEGSLHVETFALQPGDIVMMGSDGKDDLRMKDDNAQEYINEDETLILSLIEKNMAKIESPVAQEHLDNLVNLIKETGEPMDDLSLLQLQYLPQHQEISANDEEIMTRVYTAKKLLREQRLNEAWDILYEAYKMDTKRAQVLKSMIKVLILNKNYNDAAHYLQEYSSLHPEETEYLYLGAYCYRKTKNYDKGMELGERVRIREPHHIKNLINLGHISYLKKEFEKASYFLNKALELEPTNKYAHKLQSKLNL